MAETHPVEEAAGLRAKLRMLAGLASSVPAESGGRAIRFVRETADALQTAAVIVQKSSLGDAPVTVASGGRCEPAQGWLEAAAAHLTAELRTSREASSTGRVADLCARRLFAPASGLRSYLAAPLPDATGGLIGIAAAFRDTELPFAEDEVCWFSVAAQFIAGDLRYEAMAAEHEQARRKLAEKQALPFGGKKTLPGGEKRRGTVLVIDDDRAFNHVICDFLKEEGYRAESAFDGLEAMRVFRPNGFDVVMTDVAMPHMNGWELIAALRARAPELPIVLITAYSSGMWNESYLRQQGVAAVLNKPFKLDRLVSVLAEVSQRAESARNLSASPA